MEFMRFWEVKRGLTTVDLVVESQVVEDADERSYDGPGSRSLPLFFFGICSAREEESFVYPFM